MEKELQRIRETAFRELEQALDANTINDLRVKVLGKKGELTAVLRSLGSVSASVRPRIGQLVNDLRLEFENELQSKQQAL